ncbi:hypothetical protein H5410_032701 [Solanum commersonii]|uniref:Protein kinase domain-containing protein n=1 Tax=Solanum commersonii TaxID=4109 RepID=A0A9J5YKN7_SOLCO|nr:hypothetical protein H5410_032701 [Solanum commersonii]
MQFFRGLTIRKKQSSSSASAERRKKEQNYYLQNGSAVLEEFLALCDGNCRIPIRYFTATEIENAIKHSENKMEQYSEVGIVTGSLDNRLVLVRFHRSCQLNIYRDIAITAQMSHLKNVLRLVGCCLEFEEPVMGDHKTRESLSWGKRLRIANEVASAIIFLHTGFTTPIIYRDIKPHKVIIDQNSSVAKIVDFSLSISLPPGELEVQDGILCGTFWYLDPEYASLGIVTHKTDVYNFGILLFQLLTGKKSLDSMQSNIEEGNAMDRVDSTIFKDPNLPTMVELYIKERDVIDIEDPTLLEQHGIEIRQQLEDYLDLVKRYISSKGEDRPYMIHTSRQQEASSNLFIDYTTSDGCLFWI